MCDHQESEHSGPPDGTVPWRQGRFRGARAAIPRGAKSPGQNPQMEQLCFPGRLVDAAGPRAHWRQCGRPPVQKVIAIVLWGRQHLLWDR